jgi:hypothetical protein
MGIHRAYRVFSFHAAAALLVCALLASCIPTTPVDPGPKIRYFDTALEFATGNQPFAVLATDLDGDGRTDAVTANLSANAISVLLGDATDTFLAAVDYPTGEGPAEIVPGDFNGDGNQDLVVANSESDDLSVLLGVGDGTLMPELRLGLLTGAGPLAVAVGDVNNDGAEDIAATDATSGNVTLFLGVGDGTFGLPSFLPAGPGTRSVDMADLDADGNLDLVTADRNSNSVSVLMGNGDGTFGTAGAFAVGTAPRQAEAVDFNEDGDLDILCTNTGSADISVLIGRGDGTFNAELRTVLQQIPTRFSIADVDGDGHEDLVAALFSRDDSQALGACGILYGDGTGGFDGQRNFGVGLGSLDVAVARVDNDARLDLLTADLPRNRLTLVYGRANRRMAAEQRFAVGASPRVALAADVNDDGDTDLLVANQDDRSVTVLEGDGTGQFDRLHTVLTDEVPRDMKLALIDEDDIPDLVVAMLDPSTPTTGDAVAIYSGNADGTFDNSPFETLSIPNRRPRSVDTGDMDGDGDIDIVTGDSNADEITVFLNNGDGTVANGTPFEARNFPLSIHLADVNRDNALDVVYLSTADPSDPGDSADSRLSRMFGLGDGTFATTTRLRVATGAGPRHLALRDLDGDGDLDAVTAQPGADRINVHIATPAGSYSVGEELRAGLSPAETVTAEVSGDSLPDIISINSSNSINVLVNRGSMRFQPAVEYTAGYGPVSGAVGDFNNDNKADMAVVNQDSNDVSVLLGIM